jgi:hypothetical protein
MFPARDLSMPDVSFTQPNPASSIRDALLFCRANRLAILLLSFLILVPCFWHRQIEAGDLASHTYNAWLAQLVSRNQAPGVYAVTRWDNVLFDLAALRLGNLLGLHAAEKIIVSLGVLTFFWGVFSLLFAISSRPPWFLTPCIAILTYGYSFSMGFMNYWLSIGLACCVVAILWRPSVANLLSALAVAFLTLLAHPIGFLWMLATLAYIYLRRWISGLWRIVLPLLAIAMIIGIHFYIANHSAFDASWRDDSLFMRNGADQLILYGDRYVFLSYAALAWGIACFLADAISRLRKRELVCISFVLPLELYGIAFCATALLPENLRSTLYAGWIGLLVSRITTISAILGLAVFACLRPRKWILAGFLATAAVFFGFLFHDTATLNRIEANASRVIAGLPQGAHVIPYLNAPDDWRVEFIYHVVERACIGHCFSYSNYEPASGQFRLRVRPGSPIVTSSSDDAESMASGDYDIKPSDPPLIGIYQCDDNDFTKLCAAPLQPGESTQTPTLDSGEN